MQTTEQHLPPLAEYVGLQDLLPSVKHTFPTVDSIRWFSRHHRDALAAAGAVIVVTGRLRYHPDLFQHTATQIGRQSAFQTGGECHAATA